MSDFKNGEWEFWIDAYLPRILTVILSFLVFAMLWYAI